MSHKMKTELPKIKANKLYYLATPYSHPNKGVKTCRGVIAELIGSKLVEMGYHIFGPIAESSQYTKYTDIGGNWEFWSTHDRLMLERCDGLIVCTLKGWEESIGVTAEIAHATELNIPVYYVDVYKIEPELRLVL